MNDLDGYNETDVREEFAAPFLKLLGYQKGTQNDILREQSLKLEYGRIFLGRKKGEKDPVLRGRPDYVLSVLGVCRWVLEIKAPNEPLDVDSVEQAITYAKHPEVNGLLVAVMNGREFALYRADQLAREEPIFHVATCDPEVLSEQLGNILSPAALKRDYRPHDIDHGVSLGGGLRSTETIANGFMSYVATGFVIHDCLPQMVPVLEENFENVRKVLKNMQAAVIGGVVSRGPDGFPTAVLSWHPPYAQLGEFMDKKGLNEISFVALEKDISSDENDPTTFDFVASVSVSEGEEVYDMTKHEMLMVGLPMTLEVRGQAMGFLENREFKGIFQTEVFLEGKMPGVPVVIALQNAGTFNLTLADP